MVTDFTRVAGAGAALFGWSRSRFFGPAPALTPTPTLTHRTVNILFFETLTLTLTLKMNGIAFY